MSEIEFNPKRWCMKMSKYHVRREEYDIASTFRSVAETLDNLKDANAALLASHNALVEAVKKYFKSERLEILKREARAEVDRLIANETADDCKGE